MNPPVQVARNGHRVVVDFDPSRIEPLRQVPSFGEEDVVLLPTAGREQRDSPPPPVGGVQASGLRPERMARRRVLGPTRSR